MVGLDEVLDAQEEDDTFTDKGLRDGSIPTL